MIGGCSALLPAAGAYVNLGNVAARGFTSSPFTVMLWLFPTALTGIHVPWSNGTSGVAGYDLVCSRTFTQPYCFRLRTHSPAQAFTESSVPLVVNRWQHVAAVRDGASVRLYLDGEDVTGVAGTHGNPVAFVGPAMVGANSAGGATFVGAADEPTWFNRALSQAEIRRLMYAQLTGSESGLVSYHRFDDGLANYASTTATAVVSGVNGTLVGGATWVFDRWAPWIEPRVSSTGDILVNSSTYVNPPGVLRYFIPTVDSRLLVLSEWDARITASGSPQFEGDLLANGAANPVRVVWAPTATLPTGVRMPLSQAHVVEAPASALLSLGMQGRVTGSMTTTLLAGNTGYAIVAMPKYGTW